MSHVVKGIDISNLSGVTYLEDPERHLLESMDIWIKLIEQGRVGEALVWMKWIRSYCL